MFTRMSGLFVNGGAAATLCVYVCVYVRERLLTLLTGMSERDC